MFTITATSAAIATYLATKLKENKSITDFFNNFTEASVNWIKPIFLKSDGTEKKAIENLIAKPDDKNAQQAIQTLIEAKAEDDPNGEAILKEMVLKITAITGISPLTKTNTISIIGNNNITLQDIITSGGFHIGGNFISKERGFDIIRDVLPNTIFVEPDRHLIWKTMLANNKIKEAIEFLIQEHENNNENINTLFNLSGQYNFNERQHLKGIIDNEVYETKRTKRTIALLELFGEND